jgi:hypothetical protein
MLLDALFRDQRDESSRAPLLAAIDIKGSEQGPFLFRLPQSMFRKNESVRESGAGIWRLENPEALLRS